MTARPIIFSAPMVRALLAGEKTQTRRIVRLHPSSGYIVERGGKRRWHRDDPDAVAACPYGQPGDTLWVRETIFVQPDLWNVDHGPQPVHYAAGIDDHRQVEDYIRKPSIHMPRWASRLTLRITDVRIQRLQEIITSDAWAEGVSDDDIATHNGSVYAFRNIWQSIYGPDSWSANPWVWALTFDVIRRNVDEVVV